MFEYIKGKLANLTPASAVIDCNGVGYFINISLNTYSQLTVNSECQLFVHQAIKEDAHLLYGFSSTHERELFRHLISVNGIGTNTARMMLSSLSDAEIEKAIISQDVNLLKSVKGIGLKTAQRIIIDLKDKLGKGLATTDIFASTSKGAIREESVSALVMLGFPKPLVEKTIDKLLAIENNINVELLIKKALKQL